MTTTTRPTDQLARPKWLGPEQWPFTLRVHQHRNARGEQLNIHYTDEGSGPALVFVHAGMWSFIWRDVIKTLSRNFRCLAIDFPGTGLSGGDRNDIGIHTYPGILTAVLDECHVEDATFVVHDLGGVVGVLAAARNPARINGLVAANSFGWAPDRFALQVMLRVMGSRVATASLGTLRTIPRLSKTSAGVGAHFDDADRRAFFGPYRSRATSRNFHRTMRSARQATASFERAEQALAGPLGHLPVLTIFGAKNDPFGFADRWRTLFPTARQWTVEDGNHFPMNDDPDGFAAHITNWYHAEVAS
ncbi:MAG: alpha/beta fold hydrolase [Acidimicrobiales bacterium]